MSSHRLRSHPSGMPQPRFVTTEIPKQIPEPVTYSHETIEYVEEVIYDDTGEDEINIDNVDGEIEVDSHHEEWMIPMGEPSNPPEGEMKKAVPGVVLKTIDDLRMRPRIHVTCGKRPAKYGGKPEDDSEDGYEDEHDPDQAGPSGMPSIRPALRMFANAALQSASGIRLGDIQEEIDYETDDEVDSQNPTTSAHRQMTFMHRNWPLYSDKPIDYQEACDILCGALDVNKKLICTSVPQEFKAEGTFVVDIRSLRNRHDVHGDGLGSWGKPAGRVRYYTRHQDGSTKIVRIDDGRGKILRGSKFVWKCMLKRYEHPAVNSMFNGTCGFIKKIYTALYPSETNRAVGLVIVTYEWKGRTQPFDFPINNAQKTINRRPHGSLPPHGTWESSSFHNRLHGALPTNMNGFFGDIPIYSVGSVDFNTAASIILGGTIVEPSKIATNVPQGYRDSGTFVIDVEHLATDAMLRRDDNGIWGKPAGTSRYYVIDSNSGDAIRIDTANRAPADQLHDIQILCKKYEHPSVDGRFVRKIYTGRTSASSTCPHRISLAVLTYFWKGEPTHFEARKQNHVTSVEGRYIDDFDFGASPESPRKRPKPVEPTSEIFEDRTEKEFRHAVWKKEYENQMRFSALLDRAEAFITRLEAAGSNVICSQQNGHGQDWVQHNEEVIATEQVQPEPFPD